MSHEPAPWWMRWDALIVGIVTTILFLCATGDAPLAATEGHRVVPAVQMVATSNWLVPRLWGVDYLTKPPLQIWTLATIHAITGTTSEWMFRMPSGIAAGLLASVICIVSNRWFRRPVGLVAGGTYILLVALWAQTVKADIDGPHTLTAAAAAFAFLQLGTRRNRDRWPVIATGLAFGAMLLHKGPAAFPLIAGAILAPSLIGPSRMAWRRRSIWLAILVGAIPFVLWAAATYFATRTAASGSDQSGMQEVLSRITGGRADRGSVLMLPLMLAVSALPLSALLPWGWLKRTAAVLEAPGTTDGLALLRLRALIVAFAITVVIAMITNLVNPRYSYFAFPLLCPVAGAVIVNWLRQAYTPGSLRLLRQIATVTAVVVVAGHIALCVMLVERGAPAGTLVIFRTIVGVCIGSLAAVFMFQQRTRIGLLCVWLGFAQLLPIYGLHESNGRWKRTNAQFVNLLRSHVDFQTVNANGQSEPTRILTDRWVLTSPELFWYTGIDIEYARDTLHRPYMLDEARWMLLNPREWKRWSKEFEDHFTVVVPFTVHKQTPVLAYFDPHQDRVEN